jgi:histidinol phosphatase-like enzyme
MKPNLYLIEQAAQALGTSSSRCALIGDQTTDVQAAPLRKDWRLTSFPS